MKQPEKKKSICIIGGGFYGCYIAKKIKENFKNIDIEIYEKNSSLINEAGKNNQYRLHLGFHYPRSLETIKQTQEGSKIFIKEFKNFISKTKKNIYLIHKNSLTSFKSYKNIFRRKKIFFKEINLKNIDFLKDIHNYEGAINTNEKVILLDKLIPFLKKNIHKNCKINFKNEIKKIDSRKSEIYDRYNQVKKFDLIINTTYTNPNLGAKKKFKVKYEIAGMVKIKNTLKDTAITIMDGQFVSIYPRNKNEASISSVKFTPIKKFRKLKDLNKYIKLAKKNKAEIEKKIINHSKYFFNNKLRIINKGLILAPKVKFLNDKQSERFTSLRQNHKTLTVLCGKLDAAPIIYNKIKKVINKIY
tara:strand:+ start:667 stop:1743 length:1077 start_codon:yes stop_codon:yes gene_type:complete